MKATGLLIFVTIFTSIYGKPQDAPDVEIEEPFDIAELENSALLSGDNILDIDDNPSAKNLKVANDNLGTKELRIAKRQSGFGQIGQGGGFGGGFGQGPAVGGQNFGAGPGQTPQSMTGGADVGQGNMIGKVRAGFIQGGMSVGQGEPGFGNGGGGPGFGNGGGGPSFGNGGSVPISGGSFGPGKELKGRAEMDVRNMRVSSNNLIKRQVKLEQNTATNGNTLNGAGGGSVAKVDDGANGSNSDSGSKPGSGGNIGLPLGHGSAIFNGNGTTSSNSSSTHSSSHTAIKSKGEKSSEKSSSTYMAPGIIFMSVVVLVSSIMI
ncbi:hypothetical protein AYI70_g6551 [Smittium culicis]|uniref:Uncharacterized protein n=1 Tax=Smittium culicis TaxID=133412 RepID=A0A1R1XPE0_9FUNG|nr:hypothetical protein AYI70_g6551 [Smittium culicis]